MNKSDQLSHVLNLLTIQTQIPGCKEFNNPHTKPHHCCKQTNRKKNIAINTSTKPHDCCKQANGKNSNNNNNIAKKYLHKAAKPYHPCKQTKSKKTFPKSSCTKHTTVAKKIGKNNKIAKCTCTKSYHHSEQGTQLLCIFSESVPSLERVNISQHPMANIRYVLGESGQLVSDLRCLNTFS